MSIGILVLIGLALFIGGQYYGRWTVRKQAETAFRVAHGSFTAYQEAMRHAINLRGLSYQEIEKEALKWTVDKTMKKLEDFLIKQGPGVGVVMTDDDTQKDDKNGGSSGPSVH